MNLPAAHSPASLWRAVRRAAVVNHSVYSTINDRVIEPHKGRTRVISDSGTIVTAAV